MKTVPIVIYHNTKDNYEKVIGGYTDLVEFFNSGT